jgi:hypothetical protein
MPGRVCQPGEPAVLLSAETVPLADDCFHARDAPDPRDWNGDGGGSGTTCRGGRRTASASGLTKDAPDPSGYGATMTLVSSVEPREIESPTDLGIIPEDAPDVLILPARVEHGVGLYDDSVVTLVKELRAAGVSARYQHGPEARRWIGHMGVSAIALEVIVGVIGNAGWAGIYTLLKRGGSSRVRVRITRVRRTALGSDSQWYEIEGPAREVAETLRQLDADGSASLPPGDDGGQAS